jgi:hypothetical protein
MVTQTREERRAALVEKLLLQVESRLRIRGVAPTQALLDEAAAQLRSEWDATGTLQERSVADVTRRVAQKSLSQRATPVVGNVAPFSGPDAGAQAPLIAVQARAAASTPKVTELPPIVTPELVQNTSKRQRQILRDREWFEAAENDRRMGIAGRIQDRTSRVDAMSAQRRRLDEQLDEERRNKEAAAQERLRQRDAMTAAIEQEREHRRQEQEADRQRARAEGEFRMRQQRDAIQRRQDERNADRADQLRSCMLIQQEQEQARLAEREARTQQRADWERAQRENARDQEQRKARKDREREEDRDFQRRHAESLEQQDQQRAAVAQKKAERREALLKMADAVASQVHERESRWNDKVDSEWKSQMEADRDEMRQRKLDNRSKAIDTQNQVAEQQRQQAEAKRRQAEEDRRIADAMREQERLEREHKLQQKRDALEGGKKFREFLDSQVQLAHFKETQQPETSIMRPPHIAATMYASAASKR